MDVASVLSGNPSPNPRPGGNRPVDAEFLTEHGDFGFQLMDPGMLCIAVDNQRLASSEHRDAYDADDIQHCTSDGRTPVLWKANDSTARPQSSSHMERLEKSSTIVDRRWGNGVRRRTLPFRSDAAFQIYGLCCVTRSRNGIRGSSERMVKVAGPMHLTFLTQAGPVYWDSVELPSEQVKPRTWRVLPASVHEFFEGSGIVGCSDTLGFASPGPTHGGRRPARQLSGLSKENTQ